jgi:hypothetical protein
MNMEFLGNRESGMGKSAHRTLRLKTQSGIKWSLAGDSPRFPIPDSRFPRYLAFRLVIMSCNQVSGRMNNGVSICPSRRFTQIRAV